MFKPRGCQITRTVVAIKINTAASTLDLSYDKREGAPVEGIEGENINSQTLVGDALRKKIANAIQFGLQACRIAFQLGKWQRQEGFNTAAQNAVCSAERRVNLFVSARGVSRVLNAPMRANNLPQVGGAGFACRTGAKIGSAHVCTPVTHAHLVCRLLLQKTTK